MPNCPIAQLPSSPPSPWSVSPRHRPSGRRCPPFFLLIESGAIARRWARTCAITHAPPRNLPHPGKRTFSLIDLLVAGYVLLPLAKQIVLQPKEDVLRRSWLVGWWVSWLTGSWLASKQPANQPTSQPPRGPSPNRERKEQGQDPSHSIIRLIFTFCDT